MMRISTPSRRRLLALLPVLLPIATSQFLQYGQGQLPQCAQQCTTLQQAQTLCIPPDAPTVQKTCFCQSSLLTQLPSNANAVCGPACSGADTTQIQQWYTSYCQNPNAPVGGGSSSGAPPPATTTAPANSAQTSGTTLNGQSLDSVPGPDNRSWWDKHSKWVAMVIVLVIGFAIIIVVGVLLKKRHDKRVNRATATPLPTGWGPNSDPHSYGNSAANSGAALVGGNQNGAAFIQRERTRDRDLEKNGHTAAETVGVSPNVGAAAEQEKRGHGQANALGSLPGGKRLKKMVGR